MARRSLVCGFFLLFAVKGLTAQVGQSHVAQAKREYAAILSHPDSVCNGPQASSTAAYETCMDKELTFLQPHLDAFVSAIRKVQADTAGSPSTANPVSPVELFDRTNASWKVYRDNLCHLAYSSFEGGTGAAPAELQCLYEQDRAYAKTIAAWTELMILAD